MQMFVPACYEDILSDFPVYRTSLNGQLQEVLVSGGRYCQTISGDTYLVGGQFKDGFGSFTAYVHVRKFSSPSHYRAETQSEPVLWVPQEFRQDLKAGLTDCERIIRLMVAVSGAPRMSCEKSFDAQISMPEPGSAISLPARIKMEHRECYLEISEDGAASLSDAGPYNDIQLKSPVVARLMEDLQEAFSPRVLGR